MLTFRITAAVGLAIGLVTLMPALAHAGEVPPPEESEIKFAGTPNTSETAIFAGGTYKVPDGWRVALLNPLELRLYKVKPDGTKGDFIKKFDGRTLAGNNWSADATGLDPDTEYYVEARLMIVKKLSTDYAYRYTGAVKVKTLPKKKPLPEAEEEKDVTMP